MCYSEMFLDDVRSMNKLLHCIEFAKEKIEICEINRNHDELIGNSVGVRTMEEEIKISKDAIGVYEAEIKFIKDKYKK